MSAPPLFVGVDPGKSGALVALSADGSWVSSMPMPVAGSGSSARVQAWAVCDWLRSLAPEHKTALVLSNITAVIEKVHSMPAQGMVSTFSFGHATGVVYGALSAAGVRILEVSPRDWQVYGLRGKPKGTRVQLKATVVQSVYERWPESREALTQRGGKIRKESGTADAALIALWGLAQNQKTVGIL